MKLKCGFKVGMDERDCGRSRARDKKSTSFNVERVPIRRLNHDTGSVQPPVSDPILGWVDLVRDSFGTFTTKLRPVVSGVFNNDVTIATFTESGTQIYFTYGATPPNPFDDAIPSPGPGVGNNPPLYRDGEPPSSIPPTMALPQPDLTVKAVWLARPHAATS